MKGVGRIPSPLLHPCSKLVRIMLENRNLVHKYKHICSLRKYTFQYHDPLNFADFGIFLSKNQHFFGKNNTFIVNENVIPLGHSPGIRLPDSWKLAMSRKKDNDVTICWHDLIIKFCRVSLVIFSYLSKFHVSIISGSGFMTIFVYEELTRNPEIGNTPVWVLSNIWSLGKVRDTKFGTNVSNKMSLKLQNVRIELLFIVFILAN